MYELAAKAALALLLVVGPTHHPGRQLPVRHQAQAASTPAPVAPLYVGGVLTEAQVARYVAAAGFPADLVDDMVRIAWRESRFDPGAVNTSSGACGLWQLYPCPGPAALDPQANAWYAREKCLAAVAAGGGCLDPWGM